MHAYAAKMLWEEFTKTSGDKLLVLIKLRSPEYLLCKTFLKKQQYNLLNKDVHHSRFTELYKMIFTQITFFI